MNAAGRQERLVQLMRRGGHGRVAELSSALGVSTRTTLRDLGALRGRGFRIDASGGPGGGVMMDPGSVLVSPQLAVDEVVALMLAVATLRATPWMPMAGPAEAALAKIERSLPGDRLRGLRRVLERVLVGPASRVDGAMPTVDPGLLLAFEAAFGSRLMLAFSYVDRGGRATRRVVEPQALLVRAPLWYVVAWDPDRDALRTFRMDRIGSPEVFDRRFRERALDLVRGVCPDAKHAARTRPSPHA